MFLKSVSAPDDEGSTSSLNPLVLTAADIFGGLLRLRVCFSNSKVVTCSDKASSCRSTLAIRAALLLRPCAEGSFGTLILISGDGGGVCNGVGLISWPSTTDSGSVVSFGAIAAGASQEGSAARGLPEIGTMVVVLARKSPSGSPSTFPSASLSEDSEVSRPSGRAMSARRALCGTGGGGCERQGRRSASGSGEESKGRSFGIACRSAS